MNVETRFELIKKVGEEIITEQELRELLEKKEHPIAYDGFEPSGQIHIAQGILRAININKMIKAGCKFKILVADWHAWANNKMDGDLGAIQNAGKYFIEVWKASGINLKNVEFVWASEFVKDEEYWKKVMRIAINNTVQRIIRCSQIMGRNESETLSAAQIFYPCMQAADIFHLKADITQLGMDQRKVNVLAREIGPKLGFWKPIIVSHHMLLGLTKPTTVSEDVVERAIEFKMSKSKPDSAIFMTDTHEDIRRKITNAFCPEKIVEGNPILEYCKYLVFEKFPKMEIKRPAKFGGDIDIDSYTELENLFKQGKVHPQDLKNSVTEYIDKMVKPVREHFEKNRKARELYELVKKEKITR